jgi:hypothetical protein
MTSPETDPSTGKTVPASSSAWRPSAAPHHQLARAGRDGQGGPDQLAGVTGNQPEDGAITTQDPEGAVAGAGQIGGQVDDALQDDRERQLRGKGEPGSSRRPVRSPWPIIAAA